MMCSARTKTSKYLLTLSGDLRMNERKRIRRRKRSRRLISTLKLS